MRNEETLNKLKNMRLTGMAEAYELQSKDKEINHLSFDERFNLLIDLEFSRRQSHKLQRLVKQAVFSNPEASIEDIEYYPDRHLDRSFEYCGRFLPPRQFFLPLIARNLTTSCGALYHNL